MRISIPQGRGLALLLRLTPGDRRETDMIDGHTSGE